MIISVPKNVLTTAQKQSITKNGYIIIECDEPEKIRVINAEANVDVNDYFMSALFACTVSTPATNTEHFTNELYRRLKKNELNNGQSLNEDKK